VSSVNRPEPRVFLLTPCFVPYDAVGNDVYGMWQLLCAGGHDARILAEVVHPTYEGIAEIANPESDYWNSPDDILIYHHSIGWPLGESLLARTRNRIIVRYHNITPGRFYEHYARHYYDGCIQGERSTRRIVRIRPAAFWGASRFNTEELISFGAPRECCRWVPPCHLIEELAKVPMDPPILGTCRDGYLNILFVGGMKPNKGHLFALRAFAAYRNVFNPRARLIFAGSYDPGLQAYQEDVRRMANQLGVAADTVFAHSVSPSQLRAFYYVAGVFLCTSEHEGFCVPLAEAMAFRVPILAWGQTAVPETVGDAGIVHDRFDPMVFADSLQQVHRNPKQRVDIAECGRLRYESEFHPRAIQRKLLSLLQELECR
jgi:glycosyltransferase involved in cell wall biosynthesis